MTVINNNIYKLKEEIGLITMLFNQFKTSGGLLQPPTTPGKDIQKKETFDYKDCSF